MDALNPATWPCSKSVQVQGLGFRVQGLGLGFRVWGSGFVPMQSETGRSRINSAKAERRV